VRRYGWSDSLCIIQYETCDKSTTLKELASRPLVPKLSLMCGYYLSFIYFFGQHLIFQKMDSGELKKWVVEPCERETMILQHSITLEPIWPLWLIGKVDKNT
jgi:hypothetical protein